MPKFDSLYEDIKTHALSTQPYESCGLIVNFKGRLKYVPCKNNFAGKDNFILDPEDYTKAEDVGSISAIVHSHVTQDAILSEVDKTCLNRGIVPWVLYSIAEDKFLETYPTLAPVSYLGRTYIYGVQDCYTIIQDYYKQEYSITLPDPPPQDPLDTTLGEGMYKLFDSYGFVEIPMADLRLGDCIIMCISTKSGEPTHAAIYLGENKILHHPAGRLSSRDIYGGYWMKNTWKCVRYKDFINDKH